MKVFLRIFYLLNLDLDFHSANRWNLKTALIILKKNCLNILMTPIIKYIKHFRNKFYIFK